MIWKLGLPNAFAWIVWTIATFADAMFLGFLGTEALAIIAIIFPFQMLMLMMAAGAIGGGVTSSVGRAVGSKDIKLAEASCFHSILVAFGMALIFMIIFLLYSENIFKLMGATEIILVGAINYAKVFFGFSIFFWLTHVLASIIRGLGNTYIPSKAIVIGSLCQMILSYIFTFGINGSLKYGILGPAISIVICHIIMMKYLFYHLIFKQSILKVKFHKFSNLIFVDIMRVGGLGLLNSITIALTVGVITGYIGNFGPNAVAGYGIGARLELILTPIIFGIGAALTTSVSINFGSKQFARARKIAFSGGIICFLIIGFIGLSVNLFPQFLYQNFSSNPDVIKYCLKYILIVTPFYCLFGFGQAIYFSSQGTGKMIKPILVGILRFLCVVLFGYLAIAKNLSIDYVLYSVSFGLIITGLGMFFCLLGKEWKGL